MSPLFLILSTLAAVAYGTVLLTTPPTTARALVKTTAVASLAVVVLVTGGPWLLVVAFALSSLGDWFLAHEGKGNFLAGLASFLLAHVVLIVLFRIHGLPLDVAFAVGWRLAAAVAIVALCLAMLVWLWGHLGDMRVAVVAYTLTIATMVVSALALPAQTTAIVGAFAFAVSDSCLAARTFRVRDGWIADKVLSPLVWWLYWGAQVAITAGFVRLPGMG